MTVPRAVPVSELAESLFAILPRISRSLRTQCPPPVTLTQLSLLSILEQCGALSPAELAAAEGIAPVLLSRVVSELETLGLVRRRPRPGDRRRLLIDLAPAGAKILVQDARSRDDLLSRRLLALPAAQRAALRRALGVMDELAAGRRPE
jgi:DNA-binding MarR family transcriptional regulator